MVKKTNCAYCFDKNITYVIVFIIILICLFAAFHYFVVRTQTKETVQEIKNELDKSDNLEKRIDDIEEKYQNSNFPAAPNIIVTSPTVTSDIQRDPQQINSLDRIYNPLRYPYKSDYFYDQSWYPNLELPFQVVGCGSRNQPCLGGTQVPIYNPPTPRDISNTNIAPVYISTRGPLGQPQQLGVLYKVFGDENTVLPLYGRKRYPNDTKYDYYTLMGQFGVKLPIVTKNKNNELGSNDVVFIKGFSDPYRVTIYESDFPSYIPYL